MKWLHPAWHDLQRHDELLGKFKFIYHSKQLSYCSTVAHGKSKYAMILEHDSNEYPTQPNEIVQRGFQTQRSYQ